ncbi:hypothetical protein A4X09_0g4205 [Tilletia walkeri]|uniref:GLTSCR protein conserved domain-containing protein n=1 Tax=Tilletia walkeri TaxID=117179 RepID=A0A8X7N6L4_9BASI|nr:hypothetical protein A4X09_0g4205 [Tilletia walkeri]
MSDREGQAEPASASQHLPAAERQHEEAHHDGGEETSRSADVDTAAVMLSMRGEAGPSRIANPSQPAAAFNPYLKSLAAVAQPANGPVASASPTPAAGNSPGARGAVKLEEGSGEGNEETQLTEEAARQLDPAAIRQRFKTALERSQTNALMPNYWAPFTSTRDIIDRLLPYHVFDVPDEDLQWALAPPPAEAHLRNVLRAKKKERLEETTRSAASADVKGKGKEREMEAGSEMALDHAEDVGASAEGTTAGTAGLAKAGGGHPHKKRRLTRTSIPVSSAPSEPTEPPDRDQPEVDEETLLLGESYTFPSLPLAMSYYWSGLSLQQRLDEATIRSEGGEAPSYVPPPLSAAAADDTNEPTEALVAPAYNYNVTMEHLERLAYEQEKLEHARLLSQMKAARAQLDQLHRILLAAQAPPPKPQPVLQHVATPARSHQQQYRSPAPAPISQGASGSASTALSPAQLRAQQTAVNSSQVPSGTINPSIPSTPIPLLIPLTNLTQLLGMNINPTPATHITPAFRKAILDKPDLQQNPHSLLLAAERVARNARIRRNQISEGQPNPPSPAIQAELDSLDQLSVSPRVAPPNQAESALLLGISISAAAAQAQRFPGPDEFAAPSTVMLHISVVLAKLTASQLSALAALMQSLQVQAQAQAQAQGHGQGQTTPNTQSSPAPSTSQRPAYSSGTPARSYHQSTNAAQVARPAPPVVAAQNTAPPAVTQQQVTHARSQVSQPQISQTPVPIQPVAAAPASAQAQDMKTSQPTTPSAPRIGQQTSEARATPTVTATQSNSTTMKQEAADDPGTNGPQVGTAAAVSAPGNIVPHVGVPHPVAVPTSRNGQ